MKIKKALIETFTPPEPQKKNEFLNSLHYPKLSYSGFILSQISYIRKRVWLFSAAVLLAIIGAVCLIHQDEIYVVWIISALIPFLALLTTMEISRSDIFGMSEIEIGCRFSLPQLAGARMIILGTCNFTIIAIITVILGVYSPLSILKSALYVLTPYITVNGLSLFILNRVHGAEGVYISLAAALGVSLAGVVTFVRMSDTDFLNTLCTALCAGGTVMIIIQVKKIINRKDFEYGINN